MTGKAKQFSVRAALLAIAAFTAVIAATTITLPVMFDNMDRAADLQRQEVTVQQNLTLAGRIAAGGQADDVAQARNALPATANLGAAMDDIRAAISTAGGHVSEISATSGTTPDARNVATHRVQVTTDHEPGVIPHILETLGSLDRLADVTSVTIDGHRVVIDLQVYSYPGGNPQ